MRTSIHERLMIPSKSETMGIQRHVMPQIASKDTNQFISILRKKGIQIEHKEVDPSTLKATQGHFNKDKIVEMMKNIGKDTTQKSIIISKDNYVMDGHHRWLAHLNLERNIDAFRVNVKGTDLLDLMRDHPKSFTKKIAEAVYENVAVLPNRMMSFSTYIEESAACSIMSATQLKEFEKFVNRMFEKFKLDFNFTKHFRERLSDERNNPCINIKEVAQLIMKIYKHNKGNKHTLSNYRNAEVVLKDIQSDLNMPVAVEYDRKNDELDVIVKTIMRKKKFSSPDPVINV